jgi:hypothetical protein
MINEKTYKIRKFQNGKRRNGEPFMNYSLTIPTTIARELPKEIRFYCELTDEGILFRPVAHGQGDNLDLPAWAEQK